MVIFHRVIKHPHNAYLECVNGVQHFHRFQKLFISTTICASLLLFSIMNIESRSSRDLPRLQADLNSTRYVMDLSN